MTSTSIASAPRRRRGSPAFWLALMCTSACASEAELGASASATSLSLQTKLAPAPAEASEAVVAWNVTSGSPDYAYVWGRAPLKDGSFQLELTSPPPAEAMNSYGLGVGIVMIVPEAAGIQAGRQSEEDEDRFEATVGASERHAIIFVDRARANAAVEQLTEAAPEALAKEREHWLFDFEEGYGCGVGREAATEEDFDSYMPVDCDAVEIRAGSGEFDFPNWT